jgi:hypothetical protein
MLLARNYVAIKFKQVMEVVVSRDGELAVQNGVRGE